MVDIAHSVALVVLNFVSESNPASKPSLLFWQEDKMMITKIINGVEVTKEAERKEDKRYDWK